VADLADAAGAEVIEGRFVPYEAYRGTGAYDIGAVVLERESDVPPAVLASTAEIAAAGEAMLAGFGARYEARDLGLTVRRVATVPIRFFSADPGSVASGELAAIRFHPDLEFLAGWEESGPCFGDSGGPAYIRADGRRKLAGIISRPAARRKPFCKGLTILTRIDAFQDWIRARIP
jgi:secreted trypsin-like serine protease